MNPSSRKATIVTIPNTPTITRLFQRIARRADTQPLRGNPSGHAVKVVNRVADRVSFTAAKDAIESFAVRLSDPVNHTRA